MTASAKAQIALDLITDKAKAALDSCNSLRSMHDTAKKLIQDQQLGMDFDPKRNNAFEMPIALLVCNSNEGLRSILDADAVRSFADSYMAGTHVDPLSVVAENGKLRVVVGFTRYAGLMLAIQEGADIKRVWVTQVEGGRANELVRQMLSNQQVQVDPLDLAAGYRELIELHGYTIPQIAEETRRKEHHVRKMLALTNVAPEVKEMVARGEASVTTALAVDKQCKATGQDTVVHMKEQLAKAKSNGASKITPKSVGTLSALYGRKDIETAAPVLVQLADQLEQAIPFMASTPERLTLELTLDGTELDLQSLKQALANFRAAFKSAQQPAEPVTNVG